MSNREEMYAQRRDEQPFGSNMPMVGFAYPVAGGEFYSYADLSGTFTTSREGTTVPEPDTALLMCSGLMLLAWLRRSRRWRRAAPGTKAH